MFSPSPRCNSSYHGDNVSAARLKLQTYSTRQPRRIKPGVSPWDNFISFGRICTCISIAIARGVPASAADLIWLVSPLISAADPDFLLYCVPMSDSAPVRCLHTAHA